MFVFCHNNPEIISVIQRHLIIISIFWSKLLLLDESSDPFGWVSRVDGAFSRISERSLMFFGCGCSTSLNWKSWTFNVVCLFWVMISFSCDHMLNEMSYLKIFKFPLFELHITGRTGSNSLSRTGFQSSVFMANGRRSVRAHHLIEESLGYFWIFPVIFPSVYFCYCTTFWVINFHY